MASQFIGPSTTTSASQNLDAETLEESENESVVSYVIGVVLFSAIFTCAFVLTCCQIKGVIRSERLSAKAWTTAEKDASSVTKVEPPQPSTVPSVMSIKEFRGTISGGAQRLDLGRANTSPVAAPLCEGPQRPAPRSSTVPLEVRGARFPAESASGQATHAAAVGSPVRRPTLRTAGSDAVPPESGGECAWDELCSEDGVLMDGLLVGSAEWAVARSLRKMRLEAILRRGVYAKPPRSSRSAREAPERGLGFASPPRGNTEVPPAPVAPPPRLNVLRDDADSVATAELNKATAGVQRELQSTAAEDVALRKRTFKGLCARWHPDKNAEGDVELATEVFQYLQAQKAWYLLEQASTQPANDVPNA